MAHGPLQTGTAPPVTTPALHDQAEGEPADDDNDRVCHLIDPAGNSLCGRRGLGMGTHWLPPGANARTSPCAGGCGNDRCAACALAYTGP